MPSNIKVFLCLAYLSAGIGVIYSALNFSTIAAMAAPLGGPSYVITVQAIEFTFLVAIFSLIGFGRQNWARWLLLVMFLVGCVLYIPAILLVKRSIPSSTIIGTIQFALQAVALYFVFTGNARQWFKREKELT